MFLDENAFRELLARDQTFLSEQIADFCRG
jgi:hypothetical protein